MIPYTAKEGSVRSGYIEECFFFFKKEAKTKNWEKNVWSRNKRSKQKKRGRERIQRKKKATDRHTFFLFCSSRKLTEKKHER